MYHQVKGQSVIKIYVLWNMMEVCDKLLSSFGQDILRSMFSSAVGHSAQVRPVTHFILAAVYVICHSMVFFARGVVINVCVNAHNNALLVLLVSNQFLEIKGAVFKNFAKVCPVLGL